MIKLLDRRVSKNISTASRRDVPLLIDVVWIGPHHIACKPFGRNLLYPIERPGLINCLAIGRQSAVDAPNLAVNEGGDAQAVKDIATELPRIPVPVLSLALIVKAINLCDLATFVISAQKNNVLRVLGLEEEQERPRLNRIVAPVNVIAHENVARAGKIASSLEELEEVMKLAVNIAAHCDGRVDWLHIVFLNEDGFDKIAELLEVGLGKTVTGRLV